MVLAAALAWSGTPACFDSRVWSDPRAWSKLTATPALANGAFPSGFSVFFPAQRPGTLIVATNFGLIESEDGGRSWWYACEDPQVAADARLYSLAQVGTRERLFAVGLQGLAFTEDTGCQLHPTAASGGGLFASDYFIDPSDGDRLLVLATLSGLQPGEPESSALLLSRDGGRSFAQPLRSGVSGTPESLDFESVEIAATDPQVIYLVSSSIATGRQLERSSDGGATWTRTALPEKYGNRFGIITIDRHDPLKVFVRGSNSASDVILLTTDGGRTLQPVLDLTDEMAVVTAFLVRADGTVLVGARDAAGTGFGLRSADGGRTFVPWEMGGLRLRGLAEYQGTLYALAEYTMDPFILGSSSDEGLTWTPRLSFEAIKGIKPCAQARCRDDCLRLADWGVFSAAICDPQSQPPRPGTGGRAGADGGSGGGQANSAAQGCGCAVTERARPGAAWLSWLAGALAVVLSARRGRARRRRSTSR